MKTLRINGNAQMMTVPKAMIEDGFIGDVETVMVANTVTLIKPGTSLSDAVEGLKIALQELELRLKEQQGNTENQPSTGQ